MGEILPDGTIQGYQGYCRKCGTVIDTNQQGNEIGKHECPPKLSPACCVECGGQILLKPNGEELGQHHCELAKVQGTTAQKIAFRALGDEVNTNTMPMDEYITRLEAIQAMDKDKQ